MTINAWVFIEFPIENIRTGMRTVNMTKILWKCWKTLVLNKNMNKKFWNQRLFQKKIIPNLIPRIISQSNLSKMIISSFTTKSFDWHIKCSWIVFWTILKWLSFFFIMFSCSLSCICYTYQQICYQCHRWKNWYRLKPK